MAKMWGGRFKKAADKTFERFSASYVWDRRLLSYDLLIDLAHVQALRKARVLTSGEAAKLTRALKSLEKRAAEGRLRLSAESEDVHSALHEALKAVCGDVADKLHTGRSRNDLVAQSSRLYCLDHGRKVISAIRSLQRAMIGRAAAHEKVLVPGMTHLQNAQALSQAHIFLAYTEMLERSRTRFEQDLPLSDVCVLGSGALAGTTFALDQRLLARQLGLTRVTDNSYDVSGDRDFVLAFLADSAFLGVQLSRMAEDLMIAQTKGTSLVDMDESLCTGSSMMPQKKNADFVELLRGASGSLSANLNGLLMTLKGLPTSYNRDLQWDKKYLFDSAETVLTLLDLSTKLFGTLKIRTRRAQELLGDESLYATDLADHLVGKGVSFKEAHTQVGRIVRFAEELGLPISKIGLDLLKKFAPKADGGVYDLFNAEHSVSMKRTQGSTRPSEVRRQIRSWQLRLRGLRA